MNEKTHSRQRAEGFLALLICYLAICALVTGVSVGFHNIVRLVEAL